jgi:uncharacterized protein YndB with AHSA1/START domain
LTSASEGRVRVVMRNPDDGAEYGGGGEYTVIDPPRRLAFTWRWDDYDESLVQLIELEFIEHGETTTVVLTNSGLRSQDVESHRNGWQNSLDNLERALAA